MISLMALAAVGCAACGVAPERTVTLQELRICGDQRALAVSRRDFAFDECGHFGDKVQYDGRRADTDGGSYAVHCRQGRIFGIEVKYPSGGVSRDRALRTMERLASRTGSSATEHDDRDRKLRDCRQSWEFYYFDGNVRSELIYAPGDNSRVTQLNVWSG